MRHEQMIDFKAAEINKAKNEKIDEIYAKYNQATKERDDVQEKDKKRV